MTQYTLITSPTKIHKKNYKYLNYGCLNLQHEIDEKKDILINHPWDNQKKYQIDANKIKKIYLQFLGEISNKLNGQHKIKKDLRYWKIIIGPWLHSLILAYYEKNLVVNLLLKNKKKLIIPITKTKIEHLIPSKNPKNEHIEHQVSCQKHIEQLSRLHIHQIENRQGKQTHNNESHFTERVQIRLLQAPQGSLRNQSNRQHRHNPYDRLKNFQVVQLSNKAQELASS